MVGNTRHKLDKRDFDRGAKTVVWFKLITAAKIWSDVPEFGTSINGPTAAEMSARCEMPSPPWGVSVFRGSEGRG